MLPKKPMKPRSLKLDEQTFRRAKARARRLGTRFSAYVRSLIERDLSDEQKAA